MWLLRIILPSATLLGLPSELHTEIVKDLSFPDNANLKRTCKYFQDLIKFRHAEQIEAENSPYAMVKNVYACVGCQRLRPIPMFADNMLRARRRKGGVEASKRFCVECGTTTQKTIQGHSPSAHISIQGVHHVICLHRRRFDREAQDEQGLNVSYCLLCMAENERFQMALQQRQEEYRMVEERRRLRQEHEQRRAARRAFWGSGHDEDSDGLEPSPTWRDLAMDIIQAEADTYMNSPKAGSE